MKRTGIIGKSLALAVVAAMMLAGCGKAADVETVNPEVNEVATVAETVAEESSVNPPVVAALEKYNSVISGLSADQYYAFADICPDYDVLLVASGAYEYEEGVMAAIDATIYGLDENGEVMEFGTVESNGTAYPLSVYDGYLMFGGNHHMAMISISEGNMITKLDADEVFDEDGNATYYLFDLDAQFEGQVDDNSKLTEMYDTFAKATVINFTKAE